MQTDEELLEVAAGDGTFDVKRWPSMIDSVLKRLDENVNKAFPIPSLVPTVQGKPTGEGFASPSKPPTQASQATSKDNAPPPSSPPQLRSPVPSSAPNPTSSGAVALPEGTIPPPLQASCDYIKRSLSENFFTSPPHTIQRLAELLLRPRQHYKYLPQYLNALERIVSVSSGSNIFPLPALELSSTNGPSVNGEAAPATSSSFGSDESLGGALLTPIPWLRAADGRSESPASSSVNGTETSPGPATEETMRESGAVTQGELLRQEQQASDPPAPVASLPSRQHIASVHAPTTGEEAEGQSRIEESEQPHARGPEAIGPEDTGPQGHAMGIGQVLDMEAAVGRSADGPKADSTKAVVTAPDDETDNSATERTSEDDDGDVVITDVDGVTEEEAAKKDTIGDGGPDAVDTTAR